MSTGGMSLIMNRSCVKEVQPMPTEAVHPLEPASRSAGRWLNRDDPNMKLESISRRLDTVENELEELKGRCGLTDEVEDQ